MALVVPQTFFLQPHSVGRRQAPSMYSDGGWRPGRLLYTPGRASDRLVEVLSIFSVFWGLWGRLPYTPLGRCLLASSLMVECGRGMGTSTWNAFSLPWSASWCCHHHPPKVGCSMDEEVVGDRILIALGEGRKVRCCRYCSSSRMAWARDVRHVVGLRGLVVCARCRTCSILDDRAGRGRCLAPPSCTEGGLMWRRPSSPRKICAITVELHIV